VAWPPFSEIHCWVLTRKPVVHYICTHDVINSVAQEYL
jgi:hypothetical protein